MSRRFLKFTALFLLISGCSTRLASPEHTEKKETTNTSRPITNTSENTGPVKIDNSQNSPEPWLDYSLKRDAMFFLLVGLVGLIIYRTRYSKEKERFESRKAPRNAFSRTTETGEARKPLSRSS